MDVSQLRKEYKEYTDKFDEILRSSQKPKASEALQTPFERRNPLVRLTYSEWLLEQILLSLRKP